MEKAIQIPHGVFESRPTSFSFFTGQLTQLRIHPTDQTPQKASGHLLSPEMAINYSSLTFAFCIVVGWGSRSSSSLTQWQQGIRRYIIYDVWFETATKVIRCKSQVQAHFDMFALLLWESLTRFLVAICRKWALRIKALWQLKREIRWNNAHLCSLRPIVYCKLLVDKSSPFWWLQIADLLGRRESSLLKKIVLIMIANGSRVCESTRYSALYRLMPTACIYLIDSYASVAWKGRKTSWCSHSKFRKKPACEKKQTKIGCGEG